jgi:Tetratricopeptide repeat
MRFFRWSVAVVVFLGLFVVCWWVWEAFRFPPGGTDRLAVALAVATVISAAAGGPLFSWASRDKQAAEAPESAGRQVIIAPSGPVFGTGSDFRGAELRFENTVGRPAVEGQVVVGDIPQEPPAFVARQMLDALASVAGRGEVAVVCAVTGLRGVGKTQLAAAYARSRIREGWRLVGWVNAEMQETLLGGLARIADMLGVGDPQGDSLESARRLREYLESQADGGLLVFDNATDPDRLRPFVPAAGSVQVVITSTDRAFFAFGVAVDVAAFSRVESLAYLRERTGLADDLGAGKVAEELGDLPLGLAQAAATIARQHLTYVAYLERLRRVPIHRILGRVSGSDYPRSAAEALVLSIDAVESGDPASTAGRILRVVAVLSPDGVHRRLLERLARKLRLADGELDAAVERCVTGSLLTWSVTGDQLIMHRLAGRVLRERDQASGQWRATIKTALALLKPLLFDETQAWARREEGTHLVTQIEALWAATVGDPSSARIGLRMLWRLRVVARAGRQLRVRSWAVRQLLATGDVNRAIDLGRRVLADSERILGGTQPQTFVARGNLADAYRAAGRFGDAIPLFERNLADSVRLVGPNVRHRAAARSNLAGAYWEAGRFSEATHLWQRALLESKRKLGARHPLTLSVQDNLAAAYHQAAPADAIALSERTLADRKRVLGDNHPDTLTSRNNLASAYAEAGRLADAISLFERTLADSERVLGDDHPDTITSRNNLAGAYQKAGRLADAIPLLERAAADSERALGKDHLHTLSMQNNLAKAYQDAGRLADAIPLLERTLADSERALDANHPLIINLRGNLADAYLAAGRFGEAIPLWERALTDIERALGNDHQYATPVRKHLADAYRKAGRPADVIALFERTAADRERALGEYHPDTLASRNNLAGAYVEAGRLADAIPLLERTLADSEQVFGADNPNTFISRANLAGAYQAASRIDDAISLFERSLADSERILANDHPSTVHLRSKLASAYLAAGRIDDAIPLGERALADSEAVLGEDHPDTLASRNNLAGAYVEAGRLADAIPLLERTLADSKQVFGDDDQSTFISRANLAGAYQAAGRIDDAIPLWERALADSETALGEDHPNTLTLRNQLERARNEAGQR